METESNVISHQFKQSCPEAKELYERLVQAIDETPSGTPIALIVGVIEMVKHNFIEGT